MNSNCPFCGNINFHKTTIEYFYKRQHNYMIIKDVPCIKCEFCGEAYLEGPIVEKIERAFDDIVHNRRHSVQSVEIPVEEYMNI